MLYLILLLLSFFLTYIIKNYALKKSLVVEINERSSHTIPTPHGGGIAIVITWFIGLMYLHMNNEIDTHLFYALNCGLIVAIIGFIDDIYEIRVSLRMTVYTFTSFLGLYFLGGLESISFGSFEVSNKYVTTGFALLLMLWYINLTNFIDGINGYVGSELIFLSLAGFILFGADHFLLLAVAVLGFLYWNWNEAKIFMGDAGSTLLGYNIATFTLYYANQETNNLWIWITLFSLFWFDATLTLIRRKVNGEKLSVAHKKHAYQRLTQAGWSHYKVTNISIIVNVIIFLFIYGSLKLDISVFIPLTLSIIILYSIVKYIDQKKAFE